MVEIPDLFEFRMLDDSLCLIVASSEEILTFRSNTPLVMHRFGNARSDTVMIPSSRNTRFSGLDMYYERYPEEVYILHYLSTLVGESHAQFLT